MGEELPGVRQFDDEPTGRDLGQARESRNALEDVEWTYGPAQEGDGVDLGVRGMQVSKSANYKAPKYDKPEKSKARSIWVRLVPLYVLLALLALGGWWWKSASEADNVLLERANTLVVSFYAQAGAGDTVGASTKLCGPANETAYQVFKAQQDNPGRAGFEWEDAVVMEALPIPKSGGFMTKKAKPTAYDTIAAPDYTNWAVVTGIGNDVNGNPQRVNWHVALGEGNDCLAALTYTQDDSAIVREALKQGKSAKEIAASLQALADKGSQDKQ